MCFVRRSAGLPLVTRGMHHLEFLFAFVEGRCNQLDDRDEIYCAAFTPCFICFWGRSDFPPTPTVESDFLRVAFHSVSYADIVVHGRLSNGG